MLLLCLPVPVVRGLLRRHLSFPAASYDQPDNQPDDSAKDEQATQDDADHDAGPIRGQLLGELQCGHGTSPSDVSSLVQRLG
ncbi:hypothetical protein ACNQR7_32560 [Mycolicibacterium senegalense]|uniref:hypothetical protein n=1 Tax=Mycolicibacterium senegalense TaxID=1796 RepID=UPI003AAD54E2